MADSDAGPALAEPYLKSIQVTTPFGLRRRAQNIEAAHAVTVVQEEIRALMPHTVRLIKYDATC
jgi:hypothetical protein